VLALNFITLYGVLRMRYFYIGTIAALLLHTPVYAADKEPIDLVTENLTWLCDKPSLAGSRWDIKVTGDGDAGLRIKALPKIGVGGEVEFKREEWDGIKNTVENSANYRDCVRDLLPVFLERFVPVVEASKNAHENQNVNKTLGGVQYVDYKGGVELTLEKCNQRSDTLTCSFKATSDDSDSTINIYGTSAIFDEVGNKTFASYAEIANFQTKLKPGNAYSNNSLTADLVHGVTTPAKIRFQGVSAEVKSVSKVTLVTQISNKAGKNSFLFDFRDIEMPLIE